MKKVKYIDYNLYGITLIDFNSLYFNVVQPQVIKQLLIYEIAESFDNKDYKNIVTFIINKELRKYKNVVVLCISEQLKYITNNVKLSQKIYNCENFSILETLGVNEKHQLLNELKVITQKQLFVKHFVIDRYRSKSLDQT